MRKFQEWCAMFLWATYQQRSQILTDPNELQDFNFHVETIAGSLKLCFQIYTWIAKTLHLGLLLPCWYPPLHAITFRNACWKSLVWNTCTMLHSKQAAKICLNVYFCLSKCTVHVQMGNIQNDTISEELFWPLHWRRLGLVIIKAVITERGLYAPRCATCGRQPTSKTYRLTVMNFMSINNLKSWQSNKITNRNAYTTSVPRDLLPCNQSISMATPTSPWRHHTPSLHDGQRLTQWPNAQNLLANCTYRKIGIKSTHEYRHHF